MARYNLRITKKHPDKSTGKCRIDAVKRKANRTAVRKEEMVFELCCTAIKASFISSRTAVRFAAEAHPAARFSLFLSFEQDKRKKGLSH
jgi:hypothetical protein